MSDHLILDDIDRTMPRRYSDAHTEAADFHLIREHLDLPVIARFTVDGEPVSKARARFTGFGSKTRTYTPAGTLVAEENMRNGFKQVAPKHQPDAEATYGVTAIFFHGTRQRRDVDNMLKLILDGLNGVAWIDDAHVVEVSGRKCIETRDHARTEVLVYRVGMAQRLTIACEHCGEHFVIFPGNRRKFCSKGCQYAFRRAADRTPCKVCGKPCAERRSTYCSRECMGAGRRKPVPRCSRCGGAVSKRENALCRPCWASRGSSK